MLVLIICPKLLHSYLSHSRLFLFEGSGSALNQELIAIVLLLTSLPSTKLSSLTGKKEPRTNTR